MKSRILVVGSSNIDFVARMSRLPLQGETLISNDSYAFVPGGKGANAAVAAARLGGDVVFCARVGNDSYGRQLVEKYKAEGRDKWPEATVNTWPSLRTTYGTTT